MRLTITTDTAYGTKITVLVGRLRELGDRITDAFGRLAKRVRERLSIEYELERLRAMVEREETQRAAFVASRRLALAPLADPIDPTAPDPSAPLVRARRGLGTRRNARARRWRRHACHRFERRADDGT